MKGTYLKMRDVVGKRLCNVLSVVIFIATLELAIFNEGTKFSNYFSSESKFNEH